MVKLIIRDDDCNFFSRPDDIETVYSEISEFPVSFAVVPQVTDVFGGCPETKGNDTPMPIGNNLELTEYLKERYAEGRCDILLHGITHGYKFDTKGIKIPEMIWREDDYKLEEEIRDNKAYLEDLFDVKIKCFVAPSNQIKKKPLKLNCK